MTFAPVKLTPLLQVFDMTRSLAFYRDLLGFTVVSASPEVETAEGCFSHWMRLELGSIDVMLNTQYDSNERPERPDETRVALHGDVGLYVGCYDVDVAYEILKRRGLDAAPPAIASYGLKAFAVTDPDGYGIVFQDAR